MRLEGQLVVNMIRLDILDGEQTYLLEHLTTLVALDRELEEMVEILLLQFLVVQHTLQSAVAAVDTTDVMDTMVALVVLLEEVQ